jgi:DNA-binding MarR family transcriptional regulator
VKYRNIYRVLATKDAISILNDIYEGCKTEQYLTFSEIKKIYGKSIPSLRRLTNKLSRSGLIKSVKSQNGKDGRTRVFVVTNPDLCDKILEITESIISA